MGARAHGTKEMVAVCDGQRECKLSWRDQPFPSMPDQVWTGDITYLPTANGWISLAVVIDLCSRKIIGWQLSSNVHAELVVAVLKQALQLPLAASFTVTAVANTPAALSAMFWPPPA